MAKRDQKNTDLAELTEGDLGRFRLIESQIAEVDRQIAMQRAGRVEPIERRRRGYVIQIADRLGVPESAMGEIDIEAGLVSVDRGALEAAQRFESEKAAPVAAGV